MTLTVFLPLCSTVAVVQALARVVTRHPWAVLLVWALAALLSIPFAARAPGALSAGPSTLTDTESARVTTLLREEFGEQDTNTVLLLTRSEPPLSLIHI